LFERNLISIFLNQWLFWLIIANMRSRSWNIVVNRFLSS
jgi:hypothetical protein